MKDTYILGLDFSATHLGLVVLESNTSKIVDWLYAGVTDKEAFVHSSSDARGGTNVIPTAMLQHTDKDIAKLRRGIFLYDCIELFMKNNVLWQITDPTHIGIEGYAFMSKSRAQFETAEAMGMIKRFFDINGIIMHIYSPNTIKLFATGKGNAKKKDMVLSMREYWTDFDIMSLIKIGRQKGEEVYNGIGTDIADAYHIAKKTLFDLQDK